jgi:hypothetical protein
MANLITYFDGALPRLFEGYTNMTFYICVVLIQSIVIFKKKEKARGYILNIITKLNFTRNDDTISFCYKSYNNIGCDDDEEEDEVDSDDNMEYTKDAIDNMILEFSRD